MKISSKSQKGFFAELAFVDYNTKEPGNMHFSLTIICDGEIEVIRIEEKTQAEAIERADDYISERS